jgi:hypothetical protein
MLRVVVECSHSTTAGRDVVRLVPQARFQRVEHLGDLGGAEAEHVAQHECRALTGRQALSATMNASSIASLVS